MMKRILILEHAGRTNLTPSDFTDGELVYLLVTGDRIPEDFIEKAHGKILMTWCTMNNYHVNSVSDAYKMFEALNRVLNKEEYTTTAIAWCKTLGLNADIVSVSGLVSPIL